MTDVYIALAFGVLGYVMRLVGMAPALLVIGLVLGEMLERNLQQALGLTGGNFWAVISDPLAMVFLMIALFALVSVLPWKRMLGRNTTRRRPTSEDRSDQIRPRGGADTIVSAAPSVGSAVSGRTQSRCWWVLTARRFQTLIAEIDISSSTSSCSE